MAGGAEYNFMATKRLLVDAIHPEETRIVVTNGNRLEEFDFESATRRQLRGNIYLAKVTRVEPSLQAAFIEYGGNRHGFLAFSEIHPDYYQIPVADREALMREQEEEEERIEAAEAKAAEAAERRRSSRAAAAEAEPEDSVVESVGGAEPEAPSEDGDDDAGEPAQEAAPSETSDEAGDAPAAGPDEAEPVEAASDDHHDDEHHDDAPAETVESVGSGDALEEVRERRRSHSSRRNYKIQEVIKRRQVMLVQVVKEERGNKGAALTTYLSLAGRYSVLMPNTARGGGISRKITNAADRKRLKEIVGDLDIPQGQGIILRTAGASRTKAEVKRDFEYLQRLWENVRTLTLRSSAPCLVYEEGSLIKRTIRDLYSKDIDEVWVAGDEAYRESKDFMRMIMPSHAKNVQVYKEDQPIFSKYGVESQLDSMFSPQVTLPSGGYIVINPTEALVSIDVNSGRATKEHNIEDTALQTNLEAAEEISRQLRLRDLAGLIVIDFIDMMENRSNRAVERKLKDALKNDRARIQVGRISHFGLMEMSRQRIRFGVIESSTHKCVHCAGTGLVRSTESVALMVMRAVEDHVLRRPGQSINVKVPTDVALYILNSKRGTLNQLEAKYSLSITVVADDHIAGAHYQIERGESRAPVGELAAPTHVRVDTAAMADLDAEDAAETEDEKDTEEAASPSSGENGERNGRRRRRRGRGRGGDGEAREQRAESVQPVEADEGEDDEAGSDAGESATDQDGEEPKRRRRRGRRGGRRNRRENGDALPVAAQGDADAGTVEDEAAPATGPDSEVIEAVASMVLAQDAIAEDVATTAAPEDAPVAEVAPEKPKRTRRRKTAAPAAEEPAAVAEPAPPEEAGTPEGLEARPGTDAAVAPPPADEDALASAEVLAEVGSGEPERRARKVVPPDEIVVSSAKEPEAEPKPKKAGWWQRGFFGS